MALQMFVRHYVEDFATWRDVLAEDAERAAQFGVRLSRVWHEANDPNHVFFLLDLESVEQAEAFMASPQSVSSGDTSGVRDPAYWYVETAD